MEIFRSKRWWILLTQSIMSLTVLATALCLPFCGMTFMIILFMIVGFASATHDISADGFYMLGLDLQQQSSFVGIRNTFYRGGLVFGQGLLVALAGILKLRNGDVPRAWASVLGLSAIVMTLISLYHLFYLPRFNSDIDRRDANTVKKVFSEFAVSFKSFFAKPTVGWAILFMLLFRLPEALSLNLLYPFFTDPSTVGGLGAGTSMYGLVYGTFGVIALLLGGIWGGLFASKHGLRLSYWPMAFALALPCIVYLLLAILRPDSVWVIGGLVVIDQFGYGFGFTAYTLFMMRFVDGPLKTSHYAICTAFMWLSMKLPALVAGYLQMALGYIGFFILVMVSSLGTFAAVMVARNKVLLNDE